MSTTHISESIDIEARIQEFVDTVIGERDLGAIEAFVADEFVMFGPTDDASFQGIEGARAYFEGLLGAFPDLRLEIEDLLAGDGRLMFRYEASGTHDGDLPLAGGDVIPATGESATWQGFASVRFVDDMLAETRLVADEFGLFRRLGLLERDALAA